MTVNGGFRCRDDFIVGNNNGDQIRLSLVTSVSVSNFTTPELIDDLMSPHSPHYPSPNTFLRCSLNLESQ